MKLARRAVPLLLSAVLATVAVIPASANSIGLYVGPCVGGGYSYYLNAAGGTYELYGNPSCVRVLRYMYYDPFLGWVDFGMEQDDANLGHDMPFDAVVNSAHAIVIGFDSISGNTYGYQDEGQHRAGAAHIMPAIGKELR